MVVVMICLLRHILPDAGIGASDGRTWKRPAAGGGLEAGRWTACATRVLAGARTFSQSVDRL